MSEQIFDLTGGIIINKYKQTSLKNPELPYETDFPKGVTGSRQNVKEKQNVKRNIKYKWRKIRRNYFK